MAEDRLLNPALAAILQPRAVALGFRGEDGIARFAVRLSDRTGFPVAAATVRSYLNGHRTPPHPTAIAICEELDLHGSDREAVIGLVDEHHRQRRLRRAGALAPDGTVHLSPDLVASDLHGLPPEPDADDPNNGLTTGHAESDSAA